MFVVKYMDGIARNQKYLKLIHINAKIKSKII